MNDDQKNVEEENRVPHKMRGFKAGIWVSLSRNEWDFEVFLLSRIIAKTRTVQTFHKTNPLSRTTCNGFPK
jgi:hypothetical protein